MSATITRNDDLIGSCNCCGKPTYERSSAGHGARDEYRRTDRVVNLTVWVPNSNMSATTRICRPCLKALVAEAKAAYNTNSLWEE